MLQSFNKPRSGMFLIPLLLIMLLQMVVPQARASVFFTADAPHPCVQVESRERPDSVATRTAQSPSSCCETPDCHNLACQNLCAQGTAVTAPGFCSLPLHVGDNMYLAFPVVGFSDALANPPFHPPRA